MLSASLWIGNQKKNLSNNRVRAQRYWGSDYFYFLLIGTRSIPTVMKFCCIQPPRYALLLKKAKKAPRPSLNLDGGCSVCPL